MMFRLQFTIRPARNVRALAWPANRKRSGQMHLVSDPFETILYGSEALAIADLDRWTQEFPNLIIEAEVVTLPVEHAPD